MADNKINPAPYGVGPQGQDQGNWWSGMFEGANELLQNKNFLRALAETGTMLDPEGAGGIIGKPTSRWIERQQAGEAAEKQTELSEKRFQQMIAMLGGKLEYDEQGNLKSVTGNSKVSPQLIQELAGGKQQGSELGGLGDLNEPMGSVSESVDDFESMIDKAMERFGISMGGE